MSDNLDDAAVIAKLTHENRAEQARQARREQHANGKDELPIIAVITGKRHEAADAGIAALSQALIYQRGPAMVRCATVQAKNSSQAEVVHTPGIVTITQPYLERELGKAARWNRPTKTGKPRFIDPPNNVAAQILAMQGEWPFPVLSGVIGTPTMRPDGTLLLAEGYDWQTGYYLLSPPRMPKILDHPSKADAERGLAYLDDLICEFPFVDDPSRSVALSAIMTPVLRAAMLVAPCHVVTAPIPGSGKSFLFDTCAMVATGDLCPVISVSKGSAEEREKRLIGCALSGHPIISLDNMTVPLEGDFLCQLTERPRLLPRGLGSSEMSAIPNSFTVFANGQNLVVAEDMAARRTIMAELDPNVEDATARQFKASPIEKIARDRGRYIAAILVIARAYVAADCPGLLHLPSYDAWSKFVRSPLVWLGRADPVTTMTGTREADPKRVERLKVFSTWANLPNGTGTGWRASELVKAASDGNFKKTVENGVEVSAWFWSHTEFRDALLEIAAGHRPGDGAINPVRLGLWLGGAKDTIAGGYKLTCDVSDKMRPRWKLAEVCRG